MTERVLNAFPQTPNEEIVYSRRDCMRSGILQEFTAFERHWNGLRKEIFRDYFCDD